MRVAAAAVIQRAPDRVEVPAVPPGAAEIAVVEAAVVAVVVEPLLVVAELLEVILIEDLSVGLAIVLVLVGLRRRVLASGIRARAFLRALARVMQSACGGSSKYVGGITLLSRPNTRFEDRSST